MAHRRSSPMCQRRRTPQLSRTQKLFCTRMVNIKMDRLVGRLVESSNIMELQMEVQ
jgi:hypothetical protein